ncbi:MAG: hypothetical protein EOO45_03940 [Flavobacterium sp.]|nr:MAG: hypothetical protein EOO45_03940 [Flavobacterium sp.]
MNAGKPPYTITKPARKKNSCIVSITCIPFKNYEVSKTNNAAIQKKLVMVQKIITIRTGSVLTTLLSTSLKDVSLRFPKVITLNDFKIPA